MMCTKIFFMEAYNKILHSKIEENVISMAEYILAEDMTVLIIIL